jgi:hypothetical protein
MGNNIRFCITFFFLIHISCNNLVKQKPTKNEIMQCVSREFTHKVIIENLEQQDGLSREKDGVKYYEGYFNAEIKFIANSGKFKAGEKYKILKGVVSFMKTENGWNCQSFEMSASNLVKINAEDESSGQIQADVDTPPQISTQEYQGPAKGKSKSANKYIAVIDDPDGYTNVRSGMSTNANIIERLYEGENFEVYPTSDNSWWLVYTKSKVRGYVHKSRIRIIN